MKIVMDFDGVFTHPAPEGDECLKLFQEKIFAGEKVAKQKSTFSVEGWLTEVKARIHSNPYEFGWRSEGRISAFAFEDPFIRNIALADYLDHQVKAKNPRALTLLSFLMPQGYGSFSEASEAAFHELTLKKQFDPATKAWVEDRISKGAEITIVSNSAGEKIEAFLDQNGYRQGARPKVRGGAKKFALGKKSKTIAVEIEGEKKNIEVDRPWYLEALMEIQPDAIIGDVFSLDLSLPIYLRQSKELPFKAGIYYRVRDYSPRAMLQSIERPSLKSASREAIAFQDWQKVVQMG